MSSSVSINLFYTALDILPRLLLLPVLFIGSQLLREMMDFSERQRKAKEEAVMEVNTGFTNLRQTINLHPFISATMKKRITAKSHVVQENLISAILSGSSLDEVLKICIFLERKNHELEQSIKTGTKRVRQLAAKNLAMEILSELEKSIVK